MNNIKKMYKYKIYDILIIKFCIIKQFHLYVSVSFFLRSVRST